MRNFNAHGTCGFLKALLTKPSLLLPQLCYKNITEIPYETLKKRGFQGLIFDKDNTLTVPNELSAPNDFKKTIEKCRELFYGNVLIFSNTAGSVDDKNAVEARNIASSLGIPVLVHNTKKPDGIEGVQDHFRSIPAKSLIIIGDRYSTDVLFGNLNGLLTIRTEPFTTKGETFINRKLQFVEQKCVRFISTYGVTPISHPFLTASDSMAHY